MKYKLNIYISDTIDLFAWWINFHSTCILQDPMFQASYMTDTIDRQLKPYNGRDVCNSRYIEFDTEEDAVAFILRWS